MTWKLGLRSVRQLERISRALREREVLSALGTAVAKIAHEIANHVLAISFATDLLERQFNNGRFTPTQYLGNAAKLF
jgi:nitrogen-specific signal transduction histidine kinase